MFDVIMCRNYFHTFGSTTTHQILPKKSHAKSILVRVSITSNCDYCAFPFIANISWRSFMQHIQCTIDRRFALMTIRSNQRHKSLSSEISLNDSFIQVFNHLVVERVKWFAMGGGGQKGCVVIWNRSLLNEKNVARV